MSFSSQHALQWLPIPPSMKPKLLTLILEALHIPAPPAALMALGCSLLSSCFVGVSSLKMLLHCFCFVFAWHGASLMPT